MMSKSSNEDGLDIPDFLKAANRGKKPPGRKFRKLAIVEEKKEPEPPADPLAHIEEGEVKDAIREGIKGHRFRAHWFDDPMAVALVRRSLITQAEVKAANAEARAAEKAEKKALAPEFGTMIRIVVLAPDPKRKEGSARTPIWEAMKAYIKKNPNASVAQVIADTPYKKGDYLRDLRLNLIKTDLVKSDVKPEPVKIDVAKIAAKKKGKKK